MLCGKGKSKFTRWLKLGKNDIHIHSSASSVYTVFYIKQDSNTPASFIEVMEYTSILGREERRIGILLDEGDKCVNW